jgi:hypothetical protein
MRGAGRNETFGGFGIGSQRSQVKENEADRPEVMSRGQSLDGGRNRDRRRFGNGISERSR